MKTPKTIKDLFTHNYKGYWLRVDDMNLFDILSDDSIEYIIYRGDVACYHEDKNGYVFEGLNWLKSDMDYYKSWLKENDSKKIVDVQVDHKNKQIFVEV